jgi:hypothetical protein
MQNTSRLLLEGFKTVWVTRERFFVCKGVNGACTKWAEKGVKMHIYIYIIWSWNAFQQSSSWQVTSKHTPISQHVRFGQCFVHTQYTKN